MSSRQVTCAAQVSLQEIQERKNKNNPITAPQYVAGTGVLSGQTAPTAQKFPIPDTNTPPQVYQKETLEHIREESLNVGRMQINFPQGVPPTSGPGAAGSMSDSAANKFGGGGGNAKMRISQSGVLYTLHMIREPVVEYQETRGVPRNEEITFVTLVTSLCTQAYTAAITILVMLWNLMPLVDGLVYFVRFLLDKLIDIVKTPDTKDKAIKGAILLGELTVITFIIFLIVGLIFMPVYVLMARLFSKVFSMIAW